MKRFNKTLMALTCCGAMYAHAEYINPHEVIGLTDEIMAKYSGKGVAIGVVDEGFFVNHPLLEGKNITPIKFSLTAPDGKTDDFDASTHATETNQDGERVYNTHGGSVSGTIVANANEPSGFEGGVAPETTLYLSSHMPTTERSNVPLGDGDDILINDNEAVRYQRQKMATAINLMTDKGVLAINNSWNIDPVGDEVAQMDNAYKEALNNSDDNVLIGAIKNAVAKDTLLVFASGNEKTKQAGIFALLPRYLPELQSHYLAVSAIDENKNLASEYSNHCGSAKDWCIVAPGSLKTADMAGSPEAGETLFGVGTGDGTSLSAPVVSGALALTKERFDYFTPTQVRDTLLTTATDLGDVGVDEVFGWGAVNVSDAIKGPKSLLKDETYTLSQDDRWDNDLSAKQTLTKAGQGTLHLAGEVALTGVNVQEGELRLTNKAHANKVNNQSTLSVSDLTINERYTSSKDSTLKIYQDNAMTAKSGANVLLAGTLELSEPLVANAKAGQTLATVLTLENGASYDGGLSLTNANALSDKGLRQDVYLTKTGVQVVANDAKPFGEMGVDTNANRALLALSALRDTPLASQKGFYNTWLQSAYRGDYQNLHHHIHNGLYADSLRYVRGQGARRLNDSLSRLGSHELGTHVWLEGADGAYRTDTGVATRFDGHHWGVGVSHRTGDTLMMAKYAKDVGKTAKSASYAKTQADVATLALGQKVNEWQVGASLQYARLKHNQTRKFHEQALGQGDNKGKEVSAQLQATYHHNHGNWQIAPTIGMQVSSLKMDALSESGQFATHTPSLKKTDTYAVAGVEGAYRFDVAGFGVRPKVGISHLHALNAKEMTLDSTLLGVPLTYTTPKNSHQTRALVGVDVQKGAWAFGASLSHHKLSFGHDNRMDLSVGVRF